MEYRYFDTKETAREFAVSLGVDGGITVQRTNLEDVFVKLTGKSVGGSR